MKYIRAVLCFSLFFIFGVVEVKAWELPIKIPTINPDFFDIIIPTATPTPIKFEFKPVEMEVMPLTTATPTPKEVVVTQVVTATPEPSKEVEISPTIDQNPSVEPSQEPTTMVEVVKKATEEAENSKDLSKWFLQITIALLLLIIVILILPKKKKVISDKKDDLQP